MLSTAPAASARGLARGLVDSGSAACVNVVPGVRSVYRWRGAVVESGEVLLVVKTTKEALEECLRVLVAAHPYDVPEALVVTPTRALAAYGRWVREMSSVHQSRHERRAVSRSPHERR